jgi:hypothetical protein
VVRRAVDQAQAAWAGLDTGDAVGSWVEQVRPQAVSTVQQAQSETASLAPLYVAAAVLAAGLAPTPGGRLRLVAGAFAGYAANGLPLAALFDLAFGRYRPRPSPSGCPTVRPAP